VPPPFSPPAAEHLDTSGQLQRRKTKAKPSWAEMDLVLCSWETGEIFLSLDRSRRFRSADCREKSRCVTAEDLVPNFYRLDGLVVGQMVWDQLAEEQEVASHPVAVVA